MTRALSIDRVQIENGVRRVEEDDFSLKRKDPDEPGRVRHVTREIWTSEPEGSSVPHQLRAAMSVATPPTIKTSGSNWISETDVTLCDLGLNLM
ncbi:MAG: hypothetical protein R3A46_00970 [Thermomicrobiales bacterium]